MTVMITARSVRLTRIELRRNVMLWMLPVAVALFWYQAYRRTMVLPPMWNLRCPHQAARPPVPRNDSPASAPSRSMTG
jgi:hypothetical protein